MTPWHDLMLHPMPLPWPKKITECREIAERIGPVDFKRLWAGAKRWARKRGFPDPDGFASAYCETRLRGRPVSCQTFYVRMLAQQRQLGEVRRTRMTPCEVLFAVTERRKGEQYVAIARRLGRHPKTVSKEVRGAMD